MKDRLVQTTVAVFMKLTLYASLAVIAAGFAIKIFTGQGSGGLPPSTDFIEIAGSALALHSDAIFALVCYAVAFSPFGAALLIIAGYALKKNLKAALVGAALLAVLVLSLFIKSA